ncbi:MAG TPA: HlyD family efflux transporter periplasmic adaptor subunit [Chitinophagaceae bacterium]|nr:HlyD family efflux transporter periplasmic adaptor subunit [Chitinophagaceae bacterium]
MDRIIEKKRWSRKRILTIAGITALVALIAASYYYTSGPSKLSVDTDRITISTVTKGPFQETIPINGIVLPRTTIYLDIAEGGRVEDKYVEDGTIMKKGQPILKLSNTDLLMNMMSQQTTVYNTLTQMQINHNNAMQNTVNKETEMADVESLFKEAERVYNLDKTLYEKKAIGFQEYQQALNNYNYYLNKKNLQQQILQQDSVSRAQQEAQDKRSYQGSQEALAIMQQKVGDLIVRAPIDGQLTSLDAEVGESKAPGSRIGQIDVLDGFKVRADIDQHYISRVFIGLKGTFDFADTTYTLVIKKIYSQVTDGRFQVDMEFQGKEPKGIRRGQTLSILLALSDETQAILLPQGGFFNQTGGNWIFKLSADGKTAYRQDIKLNRKSTDFYEVIEGLKPGDKVVTSSYENYGNMQELVLKNN